jgi:hypothetical protein
VTDGLTQARIDELREIVRRTRGVELTDEQARACTHELQQLAEFVVELATDRLRRAPFPADRGV